MDVDVRVLGMLNVDDCVPHAQVGKGSPGMGMRCEGRENE